MGYPIAHGNVEDDRMDRVLAEQYAKKSLFEKFLLEITLAFFVFGLMVSEIPSKDLFMRKACLNNLGYNTMICAKLSVNETINADVQIAAKFFTTAHDMIMSFCGAIATIVVGQYMSKYGAKIPLIACFIGMIMSTLLQLYTFYFMSVPLAFSVLAAIPSALTGGYLVLQTAVFTNITHRCPAAIRKSRFMVLQLFNIAPRVIAMAAGSPLYVQYGVLALGGITCTFMSMALFLVVYYFEDLEKYKEAKLDNFATRLRHATRLGTFVHSFDCVMRKRPAFGRAQLISMLACLLVGSVGYAGAHDLGYMYVNHVYKWEPKQYSMVNSIIMSILFVLSLPTMLLFTRVWKLKDPLTAAVGYFSYTVKYLACSLMHFSVWIYYSEGFIGLPYLVSISAVRAHISRVVAPSEVALVFSLIGALDKVVPIATDVLITFIYNSTVKTFAGWAYIFLSFLYLIPLTLSLLTTRWMMKHGVPKYDERPDEKHVTHHDIEMTKL